MSSGIWVSPAGSDAAAGDRSAPVATLARAVALSRQMPAVAAGRRIIMHGGDYYHTAVELHGCDSNLTIEAAPGERPRLVGGGPVGDWKLERDGCASASVTGITPDGWGLSMLSVNGRYASRARYPRQGHLEHESIFDVRWKSTSEGGWERKPTEDELTTMVYRGDDLGAWLDLASARITVYHSWDESTVAVQSLDPASRTLRFSSRSNYPAGAFDINKYVVWNIRQGLTEPGQWMLDRTASRIIYRPLPGEELGAACVLAPTQRRILHIVGQKDRPVERITLRGLTFTVADTPLMPSGFGASGFTGAVELQHAAGCTLERVVIQGVGGQAIKATECQDLALSRCVIKETGACGILLRGPCRRVVVTDCLIEDVGLTYPSAIAITIDGSEHVISHNTIRHGTYTGICAQGADTRIENNVIDDVVRTMDDGGAIYITFCQRLQVRGNVVRNIRKGPAQAYYLDEQTDDSIVEGNVAIGVAWPFQNHMARRNAIRGNLLVNLDGGLWLTFPRSKDYIFEKNILFCAGAIEFKSSPIAVTTTADNLFFSQAGKVIADEVELDGHGIVGSQPLTPTHGSRIADPLFVDPARGDFRVRPDSPLTAMRLPIPDVSRAGVRPED